VFRTPGTALTPALRTPIVLSVASPILDELELRDGERIGVRPIRLAVT
jgi:hypothetical protein